MPSTTMPNAALAEGKVKRTKVLTQTVSLTDSQQTLERKDIPQKGDIVALEVKVSGSVTGTLVTPSTVASFITKFDLKDKENNPLLTNIRGIDLAQLERMLNIGNVRTVPDADNSTVEHTWMLPMNIEAKDQISRVQFSVAPIADMAASGATGGSVTVELIAWYADNSKIGVTRKIDRLTQTISGAALDRFGEKLPRNQVVNHLLFKVDTPANVDNIKFTSNGTAELEDIELDDLAAMDEARYTGGNVSGEYDLYNSPFIPDSRTELDVTTTGAATIQWYVVGSRG